MSATLKVAISTSTLLLCVAAAACAEPAPGPRITPEVRPAFTVDATTVTTTDSSSVTPLGEAGGGIREVDWGQSRLPGEFCDIPQLVAFKDGEATAVSKSWGDVHLGIMTEPGKIVYGDIDGDGGDEALVLIGCDNGGGTASGQLAFGYVVVRASKGTLEALGAIVPKMAPENDSHVTLLGDVVIKDSQITVKELWYRTSDPTCCPSGIALTTWQWEGGHLTADTPVQIS